MAENFTRDANLERYKDLDMALTPHPVTGSLTTLSGEAAIKRALKNLILLKYYDFTFSPHIGSETSNLLFENVNPLTGSNIEQAIREAVDKYESRVEIDDVQVGIDPEYNRAEISISFFIISQPAPITTTIIIQRNK